MGSLLAAFDAGSPSFFWSGQKPFADGSTYRGYKVANPGEYATVRAYVAALDAGQHPAPPTVATIHGQCLVGMLAALAGTSPPPTKPPKYELDYQTGDWSQWGGAGALQVTNGGQASIVSDGARPGSRYAARYFTPNQLGNTGDHTSRCQIMLDPHPDYGREGIEEWYAFSFYVVPGSTFAGGQAGGWNNLVSFHHSNIANTLIAPSHFAVLNKSTNPSSNPDDLWLYVTAYGGKWNNNGTIQYQRSFTLMPLPLGQWTDVLHHVKWSIDPTKGFVETWVNGQHVLPLTACANLYTMNSDGSGGSDPVYLKQGIDTAGGYQKPTTVLYDCTRVASDQATAETALQ